MTYEDLKLYQANVVKLLDNSVKMDRLSQVYLFSGARGTGKMEAALYLASLLLCEIDGACGECPECRRILAHTNENVHVIEPINDTFKKEQILELEKYFSLTSDKPQIFIINGVDKASLKVANSLLKFLEELKKGSFGILLTEDSASVLPTIKSRAEIVHFVPIKKEILEKKLEASGIKRNIAKVLSSITMNEEEALSFSHDEKILNIISLVEIMFNAIDCDEDLVLTFFQNAKGLIEEQSKDLHNMFFELMASIINDAVKALANPNIEEENIVFMGVLNKHINKTIEEYIEIEEKILEAKNELVNNVNITLLYSSLFIKLKR